MTERMIFPDLKLFKRETIDRFLVATREIYRIHPAYPYLDDVSQTKIHIEPTYGNVQYEGKNPQLLIKVGQYEIAFQDTLGMNIANSVQNSLGVTAGYRSLKNMSTIISIIVKAYAEEESSDLADELSLLSTYAARHMFNQVGIIVQGAAISETEEVDTAKNIYQTVVNLSVDIPWEFKFFTDKNSVDPNPIIDLPPINNGDYVPPGVYTTWMNRQDK